MWNDINNIVIEDQPEPDDIVEKLVKASIDTMKERK